MAIASLICAFLFAPLGIVFGHISLSQIKRTGEEGRGLAVAGLVISYLITVGTALAVAGRRGVRDCSGAQHGEPRPGDPGPSPTSPRRRAAGRRASGIVTAGQPSAPTAPIRPPPEPASKPNKPAADREGADRAGSGQCERRHELEGNIGLQLDNAKAPCTVKSFASLAQQGYFDDTSCHRLTTTPNLGVLQCGDPTGTGNGRTGLSVRQRVPDQPVPALRILRWRLRWHIRAARWRWRMRDRVRTAASFPVYADSMLPPKYTAFGTIDATGLATIDKIAAAELEGAGDDGKPATDVTIESIRLD